MRRLLSAPLTIVAAFALMPAFAADPPPPNLESPVDYVAWLNEEFGKGVRGNAAELYKEAAAAYSADEKAEEASKKGVGEWSDDEKQLLRRWIDANAAAIEKLEAASKQPGCYFVLESEDRVVVAVLLPYLNGAWGVCRAIAVRAKFELSGGDVEAALNHAATVIRTSAHFANQPFLVTALTGIKLRALAYDLLLSVPAHAPERNADYAAVLTSVRAFDAPPRNLQRALASEWVSLLDTTQRLMKDTDGDGKLDTLTLHPAMEQPGGSPPKLTPMTLEGAVADARPYYDRMRDLLTADAREVVERDKAIGEEAKQSGTLAAVLLPGLGRAVLIYHRQVAERAGVRVVLGMHAFKAKTGRWPSDLKEATADESPGIRKDPFSGGELVYKLVDGQPLVYSVGSNYTDDGGKRGAKRWAEDEACDAVFWPPGK